MYLRYMRNKQWQQKNLLVIKINSDIEGGGASQGTIRRTYEKNYYIHSLYSALERLFRCALRGHGLQIQWLGGKHSIHSRYAGSGRRYD
jgi:hypothetical protein